MKKTAETLPQVILNMYERATTTPAIKYKTKQGWQSYSWKEYFEQIETQALGLLNLQVKPGDRIAIFASTRVEWCIADWAILGIGAITVPIYQTMTAEDLEFVLNNSGSKILIMENRYTMKVFNQIKDRCPTVEKIIMFDSETSTEPDLLSWTQIQKMGSDRRAKNQNNGNPKEFSDLCKKPVADDMATILYTSGTTGQPKGVVLAHRQAISEVHDCFNYVGVTSADSALTFLPYAHILGRIEHWGAAYIGYTLAFAESIDKIRSNLLEIHPTIMVAVPRIFEKIYSSVWAQVESNIATNKIFRWALAVGLRVADHKLKHEPIPLTLYAPYQLAKTLALHKVTELFGGKLRFAISGGATMPRDIANFFHACEILILEGYGLTETTAAITVNAPFDYRFGSVGKPVGDVELRIAEDGEILVKSDKVMKEYYKNDEATKESFSERWFHTGDIGEILSSGDLKITDRKKDLIKTAGGKYVAPQRLEGLLKAHSYISNILIHGDQKKYIVALLTLDKGFILNFAKDKGVKYSDYASLLQSPQVLELVRKGVAETNTHLASFETIKRFAVLPEDFTVEAGELTPSLKVKRKVLDKKFKREIDALYSGSKGD